MPKKMKVKTANKITLQTLKDNPKVMHATIMLTASCVVLIIAFISLNSLGFFHMLVGLTIPRGTVKEGVIYEEGQITSIPEGEIRYRINQDQIVFDNPYCRGSIMLENPKISEYELEFEFYLPKDQMHPIYESPRLAPGECLVNDKLTDTLSVKKGHYTCICVVKAYDADGNYYGKSNSTVKIQILDN